MVEYPKTTVLTVIGLIVMGVAIVINAYVYNFVNWNLGKVVYQSELEQQIFEDLPEEAIQDAHAEAPEKLLIVNDVDPRAANMIYFDFRKRLISNAKAYTDLRDTGFEVGLNIYGIDEMHCKTSKQKPIEIELFHQEQDKTDANDGYRYRRTAYLCGEQYIVEEIKGPDHVHWAGPFTLAE